MGSKAEFLWNEALVSTAFAGGLYTALKIDPESVVIDALGQVLITLAGPETASSYIAAAELMFLFGFLAVITLVAVIGRVIGLIGFGSMWLAGFLLAQGFVVGIFFVFLGWGLAALAIFVYTDESFRSSPRRRYSGF